jgi:blue copper oxidase
MTNLLIRHLFFITIFLMKNIMQKSLIAYVFLFFITQNAIAQNKLHIPDTLSGTEFNLEVKASTYEFYKGFQTETYGISADYLAPVLLMKKGDVVSMHVKNSFEEDTTTMHWHGFHIAPEHDGGPHTPIEPGTTWHPTFKILNPAGTYWYHPHLHEHTAKQVSRGAAGMIIIRDEEEAKLALPRTYGVDDVPLLFQTQPFNAAKQMPLNSHQDSVALVNGTRLATWDAPAQVIRLRLLNASTDRTYLFGFSNNLTFYQIATDGGLLEKPIALTRLRLSQGERAEILLDLSNKEGQSIDLKSFASELPNNIIGAASVGMGMVQLEGYAGNPINGKDFNFLKIKVIAKKNKAITTIPTKLTTIIPPLVTSAKTNRTLTFSPEGGNNMQFMVNGPFQINNKAFDMERIDFKIPLGNTEIWTLNNQTMVWHPFHIHDVEFWLLERNGQPVPANEQGWKDVVLVPSMGTVKFITTFSDFANKDVPYMYHCHILVHEDEGMMGQFIVEDQSISSQDIDNEQVANIFPNPISSEQALHIESNHDILATRIFSTLGKIVFAEKGNNKTLYFHLPKGVYLLEIKTEKGIAVKKMIVE